MGELKVIDRASTTIVITFGSTIGSAAIGDCIGLTYPFAAIGFVFGLWFSWYNWKMDTKLKHD